VARPRQAFYWVAEYADGSGLPQYDPVTGQENRYGDIDRSQLVAFHLRPFDAKLADLTGNFCNPFLPVFSLKVNEGEELTHYRRTEVSYGVGEEAARAGVVAEIKFVALGIKDKFCLHIDCNGNVEMKSGKDAHDRNP